MDEREALVGLNMIPPLGSVKINRLIGCFGSAKSVFSASFKELRQVEGIGSEIAGQIRRIDNSACEREIDEAGKKGIKIITVTDPEYPEKLKTIYDPPPVLYLAGNFIPSADLNMGVVGTRVPSEYGSKAAAAFINEMAGSGLKFNIISGLARGIDSVAHIAAIKNRLFTAAVIGSGFNRLYPFHKNPLVQRIHEKGCIISEFPMDAPGLKQNFPRRNRVISGLSDGVIIIEAGERSGALITADFAAEQGREVFALPGSIFSQSSKGTNSLISQGAKIMRSVKDITDEFEMRIRSKKEQSSAKAAEPEGLSEEEKIIYGILGFEKKHIDNIAIESNMNVVKLNSILTYLELKGIVKQSNGKNFEKTQ